MQTKSPARSLEPFSSWLRANAQLLTGRVRFPRDRVGSVVTMPNGRDYTVFRQVVLRPRPGQPDQPGALFTPYFHVAGMSPGLNRLFSLLPIPFFVGLPGFRSKLWLVDPATGDFAGLYEWDTVEDAESYSRSFAMRFMTRRSVPGSVSCEVIPKD